MDNATKRYIETIAYLEKLFDYCNQRLFDGALDKPVITVQWDKRDRTSGWFSVDRVWHKCDVESEQMSAHELNITAQELNRTMYDIAATMVHEMCHLYADMNNKCDVSRAGTYHNKTFKSIAEAHGLDVDHDKTYGWTLTTLSKDSQLIIDDFIREFPNDVIYRSTTSFHRHSSTRKYICPCCKQSVRATRLVNIICGDCGKIMVLVKSEL